MWLGAALLVMPQWLQAQSPLDRIVAVVNDDIVLHSELRDKLKIVRGQIELQGIPPPPETVLEKQVLEELIQNKLQMQMAALVGIRVNDEALNGMIGNIASENEVTLDKFIEILESDGYNYRRFREDMRDEITISQLRQHSVGHRIFVSEREIDDFLVNQEFQGDDETEVRLLHILIALPEEATSEEIEQARSVAERARQDVVNGEDFSAVAKRVSNSGTAEQGGDLGWRKMADVPSILVEYVQDMKKGEMSAAIQSPGGFHIVKLADTKAYEDIMVEQTRARHILIRPNQLIEDEDAEKRLEEFRLRIKEGEDFAAIAKEHSDDQVSAIDGGDLGWMSPGQFVPEFDNQIDLLQPGDLSRPFKSEFGWHIVQVVERRTHDNTESVRRGRARAILHKRKEKEMQQHWLREMRDEAFVEYRLE